MHAANICGIKGCQRRFKTTYNLEKHRKLHETIGKYRCEHCNKRFIELSALSNHRRRHRLRTSSNDYESNSSSSPAPSRSPSPFEDDWTKSEITSISAPEETIC